MAKVAESGPVPAVSPFVLTLQEDLRGAKMKRLGAFGLGDLEVEVAQGSDSLWALIRKEGRGGLALRAVYTAGADMTCRLVPPAEGEVFAVEVTSTMGRHRAGFTTSGDDLHRLRAEVRLTPAAPLVLPYMPRDLYPLSDRDDPAEAMGKVEAAQRGVNSGVLYFRHDGPDFGSVLYFQNFTALNDFFRATGTTPKDAVGGRWPELGYLPPAPPATGEEALKPLEAGKDYVLSDALLVFRDWAADNEQEMARQFLQMLGVAYKALRPPRVDYRDWRRRAEQTLKDLLEAPAATRRHYDHLYVMPYVDGEYPDAMVQMSVAAALHDYEKWRGEPVPLKARLMAGMERFYDDKLKTLRRYLPNVGKEKDADAVDAWYYYHPLLNLGRLALDGDETAKDLLLRSAEYGIEAAHHFNYVWPIIYDARDFSVKTEARNDDGLGQTDVGGIYAYVMLQLHQLTGEPRYVEEARAALDAAKTMRFDLMYQANLTAWGAAACIRLWRITRDPQYLAQSYVYLASFFHNSEIWESQIANAVHYRNFLGVTCLHDAPYMAIYECFDAFTAFQFYLADSGPDLDPAVRMLVSEYCKYTLDRAWYYYPSELPAEILATEHQSGRIDRKLSFPLEDLYGDGQLVGQIGQEIYGCGAAFIFATRSHHKVEDAPFTLYCNQFVRASERTGRRAFTVQLDGGETCPADLSLLRLPRRKLPVAVVRDAFGEEITPHHVGDDRIDYRIAAHGRLVINWT
ncbi:hypothetical protein P7B02_02400 [Caulobacter segnis]|uniref:hypothetical protein n=1 Tax=Caulobacter segnis TaxID=88688 RepID=UPI00240F453E|nr:hypothetical protein [Caulobacter segnis]MDG2520378.1 hypothetical protein [Caulobacter segnis]